MFGKMDFATMFPLKSFSLHNGEGLACRTEKDLPISKLALEEATGSSRNAKMSSIQPR